MKKIFLRELDCKDVSKKYVKWMNDYKIVRFTEQKNKKHTFKDVLKFVNEKRKSKFEFLYGIFLRKGKKREHIGNIKLGPINFTKRSGDISYFIGNKNNWNKGYTTQAISEITIIAKNKFKLKKIKAGVIEKNFGSALVLKKNNFEEESVRKSKKKLNKKKYNIYRYSLKL